MRRRRNEITSITREPQESMANRRMRILEETAQKASQELLPSNMTSYYNHLFFHLPRAIQKEDMLVGE